jgi:acetylornithine deacetylase/succinyl-diaminopimelate desuccinylase-like protein
MITSCVCIRYALIHKTYNLFALLLIQDLPVNIKLILEGMEEAGSIALEELVMREKDHFFSSVDYIVISDNLWLSQRKPALTYGTRGNCYFTVEVPQALPVEGDRSSGQDRGITEDLEEKVRTFSLGAHGLGGHLGLEGVAHKPLKS